MKKKHGQPRRAISSGAAIHCVGGDSETRKYLPVRYRRNLFAIYWKALLFSTGLALMSGDALAQHPTDCEAGELHPILSKGDFDGDGTVTRLDVKLISKQIGSSEYAAFFDLNADGAVNGRDVSRTARAIGDASTLLDQQFAALFWSTERYRDINNAIADGYRPFTPILQGHGMHYAKLPFLATPFGLDADYENILDGELNIAEPEGLNYDEHGNLVAVFYYHGINVRDWVFADDSDAVQTLAQASVHMSALSAASGGIYPQLYDSDEAIWHQHWGPCWDGLDYVQMAFDPTVVPGFDQHLLPEECALQGEISGRRQGWIPAFNMLHVWLYKLNPCGVFAGVHPHVSMGFPEEPIARPLPDWFNLMHIPNPYEHGGHH